MTDWQNLFSLENLIDPKKRNVTAERVRAQGYANRANAFIREALEKAPKLYGAPGHTHYPDLIWEEAKGASDTHTARLVDVREIE